MKKFILSIVLIASGLGCQKEETPFIGAFSCLVNDRYYGCKYVSTALVIPHQDRPTSLLVLKGDFDVVGITGDMGIQLNEYSGPGTYVLSENDELFIWVKSDVYVAGKCWGCQDSGSGTVIITSVKDDILEGTFEGVVINDYIHSSKQISEGTFRIKLK